MSIDENAHEVYHDEISGTIVVSEIDPAEVSGAVAANRHLIPQQVQRALASWAEDTNNSSARRNRTLFARDRFVTPGQIFKQMALAYDALDDDIIGNVADTSESLAFQKVKFECEDPDQQDVWSQIGRDLDLDTFVRQAWRELFTVSQFYGVRWWGNKTYRVRGKGDGGRSRRREFNIFCPVAVGILDPTRVVPVQNNLFGESQLAWIASDTELELYEAVTGGVQTDELVSSLFMGRYNPSAKEEMDFDREGIPPDNLMLLNPQYVWKHSLTKGSYERWARVRMKSLFPILDLKHQLREMDRAWLLGGVNFIVLVTRGTDTIPTTRQEVEETSVQVRTQSRSPIIVTDHRINIEIITPEVEHVLNQDKWAVLDERLMMRMWGTFQLPSETSNRETSATLGKVIARGLSNRRHQLKRSLEKHLIRQTIEFPLNEAVGFTEECSLEFAPRRMEIEVDQALITLVQELRDRGDISRETLLSEFNFDQGMEAQRRETEDERYKDIFEPINVPFDSPNRVTPGGSGRQGGRPPGSGNPSQEQQNRQNRSE